MNNSEFNTKIINDLRSRLTSRRMQYDIFTFSGSIVSVNIHIPSTVISITIPFVIEEEDGKIIVYFEENEYEFDAINSAISFVSSMARKTESKVTKLKKK